MVRPCRAGSGWKCLGAEGDRVGDKGVAEFVGREVVGQGDRAGEPVARAQGQQVTLAARGFGLVAVRC